MKIKPKAKTQLTDSTNSFYYSALTASACMIIFSCQGFADAGVQGIVLRYVG